MRGKGEVGGFGIQIHGPSLRTVGILLLLLAGIGLCVAAAGEIEIRDISVRRVAAQSYASVQDLDDNIVIVGDQLHVRAVVANTSSETLSRLRVDFYFTETLTNEHGLLGSQTVFSLMPGEQRLPAISVPTDGFTPGRYIITAAVALQNAADYTDSFTSSEDDEAVIRVNGLGPAIAEITTSELTSSFRKSQFGGLDDTIAIKLYNVGTTSFGGITIGVFPPLTCGGETIDISSASDNPSQPFLRFSDIGKGILDLQVVAILGEREKTLPIKELRLEGNAPGETMRLITRFCTDPLDSFYQPADEAMASFEVLGQPAVAAEPLSIELSIRPGVAIDDVTTAGTTRKLVLPSEDAKATVYSELDLWQFPLPDEENSLGVPTVMPSIQPAAQSSELIFHVTQETVDSSVYQLHAIDPEDGSVYASLDLPSTPLTDPMTMSVSLDENVFEYRLYYGMATGAVDLYSLTVDKSDASQDPIYTWGIGNAANSWQSIGDLVDVGLSARPTTYVQLGQAVKPGDTDSSSVVVVSGPKGIYVLDVETGSILNGIPSQGITTQPAIVDGYIWYAQGTEIHSSPLIASEDAVTYCTPFTNRVITTPIVHLDGVLFWGTSGGGVNAHIIGTSCDTTAGRRELSSLGDIVGISLGTDTSDTGDPILFVTGKSGGIASYEFNLSDPYPVFQKLNEATNLILRGEDEPHELPASKATTLRTLFSDHIRPPTMLDTREPRETVFFIARFESIVGSSGALTNHWSLVALNGSDLSARRALTWGKSVSYVLKMEEEVSLILEPIVVPPSNPSNPADTIVVVVPGKRLYALNVGDFSE